MVHPVGMIGPQSQKKGKRKIAVLIKECTNLEEFFEKYNKVPHCQRLEDYLKGKTFDKKCRVLVFEDVDPASLRKKIEKMLSKHESERRAASASITEMGELESEE